MALCRFQIFPKSIFSSHMKSFPSDWLNFVANDDRHHFCPPNYQMGMREMISPGVFGLGPVHARCVGGYPPIGRAGEECLIDRPTTSQLFASTQPQRANTLPRHLGPPT